MALLNSLGATAQEIHRRRLFGKFNTLIYAQGVSGQQQKQAEDIKKLNLGDLSFDTKLTALAQQNGQWKDHVILAHDNSVLYVFIPQFLQNRELDVIIENSAFGFGDLVGSIEDEYDTQSFLVGVNGSLTVKKDYSSLMPSYIVSGHVYQNGSQVLTSKTKPTRSSLGSELSSFQFYDDQGQSYLDFLYGQDPSKGDGLGGLSPVVFNGEKVVGTGETDGIVNSTFNGFNGARKTIGRHILAYRKDQQAGSMFDDSAFIFIIKDNVQPGMSVTGIRNFAVGRGFDFAVALDGSNSVLLYDQHKRRIVDNGFEKNLFCKTAYCIR